MKSPIKNKVHDTKALHQVLKLIPEGSVVDSYLFFGGDLELSLSKYNRFICARTTRYVIYEFWMCLMQEPKRLYDIISSEHFKFDEVDLPYMQKKWAHFKGHDMRSAMFYLLNKCTKNGDISFGEIGKNILTHADMADLVTFRKPNNMHIIFDKTDFETSLSKNYGDYIIISAGKHSNNFFEDGKAYGLEQRKIDHKKLFEFFNLSPKKIILIYNYKPTIIRDYKNSAKTLLMLNQHGNVVEDASQCKEILIANF